MVLLLYYFSTYIHGHCAVLLPVTLGPLIGGISRYFSNLKLNWIYLL